MVEEEDSAGFRLWVGCVFIGEERVGRFRIITELEFQWGLHLATLQWDV